METEAPPTILFPCSVRPRSLAGSDLHEVGPDQIVRFKQAMPEISTTEGFPADKRSLDHCQPI
jgi:hypothetical protein